MNGEYSKTADFEAFLKRPNTGGPRNDIARLAGARFVTSIEVDEGKKLAEGLVKMITGGDTISARFLYKESFEFIPQLKLFLAANHAPQVDSEDEAMWRRIVRIPFDHVIPVEKRDPALKKMLKDVEHMGPTILNWAIEGCMIWQKDGLVVPDVLKQATSQYREDMDPIKEFLDDRCVLGEDQKASVRDMQHAYKDWAEDRGYRFPLGPREFNRHLRDHGCQQRPNREGDRVQRYWFGIGLAAHDDQELFGDRYMSHDPSPTKADGSRQTLREKLLSKMNS